MSTAANRVEISAVPRLWYYTRVRTWESRQAMLDEARASDDAPLLVFWECGIRYGGCGRIFQDEPPTPCSCGGRKNEQVWLVQLGLRIVKLPWKKGYRL